MKTQALLCLLSASGTIAQSALADCHREGSPDWSDCDILHANLGWRPGVPTEITRNCNRDTDIELDCMTWSYGSCQFGQCFPGEECQGTDHGMMWARHRNVEDFCRPDDLGGRFTSDGGQFFEVIRYLGARAGRRRSLTVEKKGYSLAEYERRFGEQHDVKFSKVIDANALEIVKRQDQGEWTNLISRQGVIKPGTRHRVNTIELSPGIDMTWEESSSYSISVGVTAGVSASLFEIFSASMEISTGYEETYSAGSSLTYNTGNCPQNANIYYAPVFTMYEGYWSNDQDTLVEIWVAQTVNGNLEGRFITECVGTAPPN
ncbi:uncharacterized protein FIESC28_01945 [Fusarium coffeatum]|uniref:Uncharacterized protein n=1 Tax=Fusarium coffeatum TaxID=231269 RepID=A0A366S931_9HYPO|nr:uncharacterized protein FIESC28_01945 [Fusarium coffeatum]RBR25210.1 hypothetical protein FIESC28_01945 [Fusarium coffeatum]